MITTLADRIRETALWVPRAQATTLRELAFEIARMERAIDEIVEDAQAEALALARAKVHGHG
jgi:hypothetical protein